MRIGVFSKFDCSGGSEFRCAEMANALSATPGCQGVLLAERGIPPHIRDVVHDRVEVHDGVFSRPAIEPFYLLDRLLVVNTDSKDFTSADYWQGRSRRHPHPVDLHRLPAMAFLFNFIVSPAVKLTSLAPHLPEVRIITANRKFYEEIDSQDRYAGVRNLPRMQLESPIDPKAEWPPFTEVADGPTLLDCWSTARSASRGSFDRCPVGTATLTAHCRTRRFGISQSS